MPFRCGLAETELHDLACALPFVVALAFSAIEGTQNPDGSYSYILPEGAEKIVLVTKGDSNNDGKLTSADYGRLNAAILDKITLTPEAIFAADVNGDGKLTSADYGRLNAVLLNKTSLVW